jgi:uncharacterized coiled-coil protein SlyX
MTAPIDLDTLGIEELVDLKERVEKKLNDKIAAEKSEIERRQAALARLEDRAAGKKPPKAPSKPKAEGAVKGGQASKPDGKDGKPAAAGEGRSSDAADAGNPIGSE